MCLCVARIQRITYAFSIKVIPQPFMLYHVCIKLNSWCAVAFFVVIGRARARERLRHPEGNRNWMHYYHYRNALCTCTAHTHTLHIRFIITQSVRMHNVYHRIDQLRKTVQVILWFLHKIRIQTENRPLNSCRLCRMSC